jgi:hypothetical protein
MSFSLASSKQCTLPLASKPVRPRAKTVDIAPWLSMVGCNKPSMLFLSPRLVIVAAAAAAPPTPFIGPIHTSQPKSPSLRLELLLMLTISHSTSMAILRRPYPMVIDLLAWDGAGTSPTLYISLHRLVCRSGSKARLLGTGSEVKRVFCQETGACIEIPDCRTDSLSRLTTSASSSERLGCSGKHSFSCKME